MEKGDEGVGLYQKVKKGNMGNVAFFVCMLWGGTIPQAIRFTQTFFYTTKTKKKRTSPSRSFGQWSAG